MQMCVFGRGGTAALPATAPPESVGGVVVGKILTEASASHASGSSALEPVGPNQPHEVPPPLRGGFVHPPPPRE